MFAFGDSSHAGEKYVHAQFRADASLGWVIDLRSYLNLKELKYGEYTKQKQRVASNVGLSAKIKRGLGEAEIVIIDRPKYIHWAVGSFLLEGAEWGFDFGLREAHTRAAEMMIGDSPIGLVGRYGMSYWNHDRFSDNTSSTKCVTFTAASLLAATGGKLRDAEVLAARSHAMLTQSETWEVIAAMNPMSRGGTFLGNFERLKRMGRTFDVEHEPSTVVLNQLVEVVADSTHIHRAMLPSLFDNRAPIEEQNSIVVDHIQACDFAAGWAVDLLIDTSGDYRVLAKRVKSVLVNGVVVPD